MNTNFQGDKYIYRNSYFRYMLWSYTNDIVSDYVLFLPVQYQYITRTNADLLSIR